MIPIVTITNSINFLIAGFLAARLYFSYKKHPTDTIRYFLYFYGFFAAFWLVLALPGILQTPDNNGAWIVFLSYGILYVALASAIRIPFILLGKRTLGNFIAGILLMCALIVDGYLLFYPSPYTADIVYPFIYWRALVPSWIRIISGIASLVSGAVFAAIFIYLSYKNKYNQVVYYRSISLAIGIGILAFSSVFVYFIAITSPFIGLSLASLFVVIGLSVMAHGVLHEHRSISEDQL